MATRLLGWIAGLCALFLACTSQADVSALARLTDDGIEIVDEGGAVVLTVPMTQPVPWTVHTIDGPPRLIIEFRDLELDQQPKNNSASILDVQGGRISEGHSRLVAVLREPLIISNAEMNTENGTELQVRLFPTTAEEFLKSVQVAPEPVAEPTQPISTRPLIMIDPGHGGIDPGAEAAELRESDLMLSFAKNLRQDLLATGQFDVQLTREEDMFASLEQRLRLARAAHASVFISLHADALAPEDGRATGLTVYTLSETFTDEADQKLAERHALTDILAGADLSQAGDDVALVLMDVARRDTAPRSQSLSRAIVRAFERDGLKINSRPERQGNFAVLRAADIPSVLVELGFLSTKGERERLTSTEWQAQARDALTDALILWADEDRLRREAVKN